ncbi:Na+/H+ antiporter NhaC family protein [Neptunomonas phycophila]|uniref:Na+/H+ antiporter NhaC family protein n=1 Tax=Neptunomonas phycophila TaxID=1572645 RepID=A0AAW7XHU4_9GAMM|nr:Na+/H+ antiporter NhaC family protein [Neptunomonas phycophila]MBT3147412.1 Na+/H+ antiporter NhaC family protein [Neptunomonas phycophila]MDO6453986.1 Na+/H+ antiporter NhaC family protein [Neptunomonas phycophila]MDO6785175.1 Na+/H+ antiporter NhaC family protein [Neptunomonas phycophila]
MRANPLALLPLLLFLALFIGSGVYYQAANVDFAFYQISAPVAILPAIVLALALGSGALNKRLETFINGVGDNTIITMCLIYLLAGAFASVAKAAGGVDATVNFGLSIIPSQFVLPGLFIITAFVATAMGTSMGTIGAIAPIALGLSEASDLSLPLCIGAVVGGAMFGDNLSIISDTTIAATRSQGCAMRDKFRMNFLIALPAAILTLLWLYIQGADATITQATDYEFMKVIPYIAVLVLAISGLNVLLVLFTGIILAGAVALLSVADYSIAQYSKDIYAGYTGMQEILILSLLIGGLGALMKAQGGLEFLAQQIQRFTNKRGDEPHTRAGEAAISVAVALTNVCTANNTVAIIISGGLAKDIADRQQVDPRRSACLLDIFSCVVQGLLPYGAQVLLAGSIAGLSPLLIIGNIHYSWLLGLVAIGTIIFRKHPHAQ